MSLDKSTIPCLFYSTEQGCFSGNEVSGTWEGIFIADPDGEHFEAGVPKRYFENTTIWHTTKNGIVIRMKVEDIRVMGRATQGVKVIRLDDGDSIGDVAVVRMDDSDEEE